MTRTASYYFVCETITSGPHGGRMKSRRSDAGSRASFY